MLYFDHNATAPLSPAARDAWLEAHARFPANPASAHRLGQRAERALEEARETLAALLAARPETVIWTSGATESANAALAHLRAVSPEDAPLWISAIEHPCVLEAAERWFPGRVERLQVMREGRLDPKHLAERLAKAPRKPAAVVLMAANNETGVLQPWQAVAQISRSLGVPMVCDATQWVGRLPAAGLGVCDFVFGSTHKCGGPVGTGFLKIPGSTGFVPLLLGGGQEEGRRAGTQNVAGALAAVAALLDCESRMSGVGERLRQRSRFERALLGEIGGQVIGARVERLWNTVAWIAPELADCRQRWVVRLDAAGVAASSGSACASGREKGSHVLEALGLESAEAGRTLRLSAGWGETPADWEAVLAKLGEIHRRSSLLGPERG
ncbi:MAG: hypothetical protein RLZZ399_2269 [Verrucomicrobiota bacterium]|jgi:cysteine desulfurase